MVKKKYDFNCEEAVSPVVGVLLMLVVTIIIAAVVSGFAGGLAAGEKKAPTLAATVFLELTGDKDSGLHIKVDSISEPIPSKDLKIITSWSKVVDGEVIQSGNTTTAENYYLTYGEIKEIQPFGYGPGVDNWRAYATRTKEMHFGNYTLEAGTTMTASPYRGKLASGGSDLDGGYGPRLNADTKTIVGTAYQYHNGAKYTYNTNCDGMQGVLGYNWNITRPGDVFGIKIIHLPSQKAIFDKEITATGRSFV